MKNLNIKISLATVAVMSSLSLANAAVILPEPGTFGLFAGGAAVAIILTRIMKKK